MGGEAGTACKRRRAGEAPFRAKSRRLCGTLREVASREISRSIVGQERWHFLPTEETGCRTTPHLRVFLHEFSRKGAFRGKPIINEVGLQRGSSWARRWVVALRSKNRELPEARLTLGSHRTPKKGSSSCSCKQRPKKTQGAVRKTQQSQSNDLWTTGANVWLGESTRRVWQRKLPLKELMQ